MKKPTLFEKWLLTEAERAQALKELNEAFDPKDEMRIRDIITKARGKKDTELSLARTMAHMIKDEAKAVRRAEAAEHLGQNEMANIFYARANELAGGSPSEPAIEEPTSAYSEEPTEEPAPKPRIVVQPRPKPNHRKPGDYFKISAKMILDGDKVGLSDGKAWRFIKGSSTGNRQFEVEAGRPYRAPSGYGRKRRPGQDAKEPTAFIDSDYLRDLEDQAIFYVKASKVGSSWIEGHVCFTNGLQETHYLVRFKAIDLPHNGPELAIFLEHEKALLEIKGETKFFIGDEDFVMKKDGSPYDDIVPGTYTALALDHDLTVKCNDPVVYCVPEDTKTSSTSMKGAKVFFSTISKFTTLQDSIAPEQIEVVAEFFSKEIGAVVKATGNNFSIPHFDIQSSTGKGYLDAYRAGPFFTREKAEKHIEEQKEKAKTERLPYDTSNLRVNQCESYHNYNLSFSKMMDFAKLVGVEVKLRKFFEEKRGAVTSKKFGF
jgi:hypothetical protein